VAEDFNIRISADTSDARSELAKFKKVAIDAAKSTRQAMSQIIDISDSFSTTNSVGELKKLTSQIVKLKKAAGDKGIVTLDSNTSLAKVVENALKPSKAKGSNASEIKRLQKQLSKVVSAPSENITQVTSLLESMRGAVSLLSRPNKQAAKEATQLRRELDNLRKEFTALSRSVNAGTATPQDRARKTQLESFIPKTQARLASAVAASKPSGEMKRMLETAQRGVIEGTQNLQGLLENLVDFAETLDQTTTGAISGAGQDLLSGNAVRSLAKNLQAATGSNANRAEIVRAVTSQVVSQLSVRPSRMSKPLSRSEQAKLQGKSSIFQYEKFGASAFTERDQTSSSGVMHNIVAAALQAMYPDRAKRGQGLAVTFKGMKDEIAKLGKDSNDNKSEETGFLSEIESLTEAVVNGLEEMIKKDEGEEAAAYKGRTRKLSAAQASVKEAFSSMQTVEGNPDEQANTKELEAYVRGLLKDLSFGARGGKGGKRIGGSFVPTQWDKLEKTGGYIEGGYRAKDMNMGFFPVEEATAMQDGFQYATVTAQEFADAMLIAVEVFSELQKVVPNPGQLVPYAGNKALSTTTPVPKLTQEQIAAWLKDNPQGFKPGVKLGASEAVFGKNTIGTTVSAMIDAVNKKFMEPTGNVSEINSVVDLFEKLSPSMQNLIGVIEDLAIVEGKITASFARSPGQDETMGLNLSGPHMNTLEQLFSSLNFNPAATINGNKYQGGNYPGLGLSTSAINVPILKIGEQLKKDFAAIYGGDMMTSGGKKTTVDPRTFRPSTAENAVEMKAIDAFIENRRAFIDYIVKAGNRLVIDDITMGLPNVDKALDSGSYTRFGGPGATEQSYGDIASRERLYARDPITTRARANKIFGGAKAADAGVNTVDGIRQGLKDGSSSLEIESRALAEALLNAFEKEMGIQSPSKEMYIRGQYTVEGLVNAIKDGKVKLTKAGKELADSFHTGYSQEEKLNAIARIQDLEKQGLGKPAGALRASMSSAPVRDAASSATDIAMRNKEAARLIDALAGVEGALIAFDDEKTASSGMFGVSMVGGTGRGDTTGIYHNMVVPPNFRANASEAGVLGLEGDPTAALKKRVKGLGYGPQNINDPSAQRKMAEDLAYLIQRALDKNIPIAMHNIGYSDWNDLIKLMEKFQIDGAPARDAANRGLLIETQGTARMAAVPGGKKLEELYTTLFGKGFSASLRPGMGNVPTISDKNAVAHDPTIDASATLEIAFELKKILGEMGFQGKGIDGRIIKAIEGGWQSISELVLGARTHGGAGFATGSNQFRTKALSYKGLDGGLVPGTGTKVNAQAAMRDAQNSAKSAVVAAGKIDRLTREERNVQIQQRLDIIEELKLRLKALLSGTSGVADPSKIKAIQSLQSKINSEMADPTISKEWQRRMATSGGIGGGSGAGSSINSSSANQGFEAEAKRRSVASKKIQGQMKDEMSIMGEVERYNRKMMDSWISGRYALYDMANTYQQFTRAGMKVATFLKQAIMLNAQYETSFTGVERVMQPLSDEIAGMRNEIVKLSTELPVAFDELSRISTLAGQMGLTAERITEFTREVSQFGTVTGIATDEVAAKFGSIAQLTHTATNPEGFKQLGSAVAYAGISAVATDQEILTLTESIASATTQAGFSADQTIGLATAISSLRIAPEQARGVITRLFGDINRAVEGGGQPLQAYAKHLGLTAEQAKELFKADPQAFFTKMLENVKNSQNSTMALDALNIKETREVNTIQKLSENMDVYNSSMADAAEAYKNGTFLSEAYGKSQDNVATKITLLQNQFKTLQDSIGEALGPGVGVALELINGLVEGLTKITKNPVGAWAVNGLTAIAGMLATMVAFTMVSQKATASMLAFRTAGVALAKMGGGESGLKGFLKQLTGQEVLIVRSNGRIEALNRKRLELAKKNGEINVADPGSAVERTLLNGADPRRGELESTGDMIAQKNAMRQATLDETNQDRISTTVIDKNTTSRQRKALATREAAVAAKVAAGSTITEAEATILSTAAINREIASRQAKIAALAAENVQLQASTGTSARAIASTQARIVANNAATASIQREIVALQARNATAASGVETVAVVNKKSQMGLGGILGKLGLVAMAASLVLGVVAGISEAIEGAKVDLEESGGGLASFREAIYADTRAWKDGADAVSTYDSKITTTKASVAGWAAGMQAATGGQKQLESATGETTTEIDKQTLALGQNSAAWLAQAAMSDTNVQDMFKKYYKVDGPGLGDMAAAAGTKVSDIILAALEKPGTGATAYINKNFNIFAEGLVGKGAQVKESLLRIAKSLDSTTAAGVENSKMVKALTEGFSAFGEEVDGVGAPIDTVAEKIRTLTDYTGDLSSLLSSAFTIRFGKTEAVDKLTTAWAQLRNKVKQAREEIANIQRDITGMQADANILQYQLNIAIKYGDTKRADKLRAEIAAKEQEMTAKNSELAKAQSEASTSLVGNSEAAIENRNTLRGLITDYNNYLVALANTAKFEKDPEKKKKYLQDQAAKAKADLITLATGLGFKENELTSYIGSFDDFGTILDKLPKELTLRVIADPGTRAFMEWWAQNKGNFNPTGGAPTTSGAGTDTGKGADKGKSKGTGDVTGAGTTKDLVKPLTALDKITNTKKLSKYQADAVTASSTDMLVRKSAFAVKAYEDSAKALYKKYQTTDPVTANKTLEGDKLAAFNKEYAAFQKLKIEAGRRGATTSTGAPTYKAATAAQIDNTQAAKEAVADALSKQPAAVQEAVNWLKTVSPTNTDLYATEKQAWEATKKPYADAKKDFGLPGDMPWRDIAAKYPGSTSAYSQKQKKKLPVLKTLQPFADQFNNAWNSMKENVKRGALYRQLLKNLYNTKQLDDLGLTSLVTGGYGMPDSAWTPDKATRYAVGGRVTGPGSGTSDSVPAMLSNGEYVIRAKAARAIGTDNLDAMNNADRFAKGGMVGKPKTPKKIKATAAKNDYNKSQVLSSMASYERVLKEFFSVAGEKFSINGKNPLRNIKFDETVTEDMGASAFFQEGEGFTFGKNSYDKISDGIDQDSGDWLSVDELVSHEISHWFGPTLGKFGNYYKKPAWWPKNKTRSDILEEIKRKKQSLRGMSPDRAERFNSKEIVPLQKLVAKMGAEEEARKLKEQALNQTPYATDVDTWEEFRADALAGALQRLAGKKRSVNQENFFSTNGSIWNMANSGLDELHSNSRTQSMLMDMGYAHPIELLKLLNIKIPKQFLGKDWSKEFEGSGIPKFNLGNASGYDDLGTWKLFKPFKSGNDWIQPGPDMFNSVDLDLEKFRQWRDAGHTKLRDPLTYKDTFAMGGLVTGPGTGTSDSIDARLSNGEFVMSAAAVRGYGPAFMNALNQQQLAPRYAMQTAAPQVNSAQVVYLSPEDRNLLRAAIDRPVNLYTDNARIAQSANAGNVVLAQRGRN